MQLGVLVDEMLMGVFKVLQNPLEDHDANCLRDIALKLIKDSPENLNDALSLMKLAKRARPKGPLIGKKVDEWSKMLIQDKQ